MDNSHLRRIIIKIQARLSDDDRKYLHFFFGDDIPRRIRDDPTLGGTLCAMESLFDRDIISGDDFTYLINAFETIGCLDAVTILKEHQQQMKLTHVHQSMLSLISIMPPLPPSTAEVFADQYNSLVIEGQKFGSAYGTHFDDSTHPYFTSSHYLNGIITHDNNDSIESYRFYYSNSSDNQNMITSERHGKQTLSFKKDFYFDKNEKIARVEGQYLKKIITFSNGTNLTMPIITGLQFYTTNGHASPSYSGNEEGDMFEEEYKNYTLWYVTGRSDEYIHQLQFYWYRTLDSD
ncbi:unnamed protein product [Adineta steineri]|uniref:Uncharacterized protein n=1 Tax=Adineta steineri TaxID=433720 RepID=A0A813MXE9_9BILA|nr:unnamed protein product [Adineta steineri]CAF0848189.1 unnamed protein product [Adineta steineri]CAF1154330.1 unnamed protein product [Adineta steineri]